MSTQKTRREMNRYKRGISRDIPKEIERDIEYRIDRENLPQEKNSRSRNVYIIFSSLQ